jgi:hypothetical protein
MLFVVADGGSPLALLLVATLGLLIEQPGAVVSPLVTTDAPLPPATAAATDHEVERRRENASWCRRSQ